MKWGAKHRNARPDFRAGIASVAGALSVVVALALDAVAWLIIRKIMEVKV